MGISLNYVEIGFEWGSVIPGKDSRIWISNEAKDQLVQLSRRYYFTQKNIVESLIKLCVDHDLLEGFDLELYDVILKHLREKGLIDEAKYLSELEKPVSERTLNRK